MTYLQDYLQDGADYQARAVLAVLQATCGEIEGSYCEETGKYLAIGRWENFREQGYVAMLKVENKQLNIAFFEHRNSDSIHAIKWEQKTTGTPNIDTAQFGDVYKDKYDTSFYVKYGKFVEMAEWIHQQFLEFWNTNKGKKVTKITLIQDDKIIAEKFTTEKPENSI